jgi:hypothetical protein
VRESNIGNELKDVAQEVMRFGERCVQAGRSWLNERRDEMNNRNDGRDDYGAGRQEPARDRARQQVSGQGDPYGERGQREEQDLRAGRGPQGSRSRGEYYGGAQFGERTQGAGWDEEGSDWGYEGGPERFSTSGYSEGNLRASGAYQGDLSQSRQGVRQYGRQPWGQAHGQDTYASQRGQFGREQSGFGASDYYGGRQGYGAPGAFGSDYNTYGRNQGFGEGSAYTRQQGPRQNLGARERIEGSHLRQGGAYGSEQFRRGPQYAGQDYLDEGEMSGYRGTRELSTQEYASRSSGRYGTEPGQFGYGGYGLGGRGFRGIGPKNYTRSDERLTEEINERLTDDDDLDASEITVRVQDCKVTLEGSVDQRWMKHRAEDIADACSGVREVDNRITVTSGSSELGASSRQGARTGSNRTGSTATGSSGTTTGTTTGTSPGSGTTGTH